MSGDSKSDPLHELFAAVCDGHASETQMDRLSELLQTNDTARDEYLRYIDMHSALADETLPRIESNLIGDRAMDQHPVTAFNAMTDHFGSGVPPIRMLGVGGFAVVMCLVLIVGFWSFRRPRETGTPPSSVASVLLSENCVWTKQPIFESQRLPIGLVSLKSGTAVLRTDSGAELVVVGPAEVDLLSAERASVRHGEIVVRVNDGGEGFALLTPTSEVIDLGTEFAVKVAASGDTEVHVLDGEVSYRELQHVPQRSQILHAGEAIVCNADGQPSRSVPMNAPRFHELVNRINPGSRTDLTTVYEGFHYSAGVLPLAESTVGKGWMGPWDQLTSSIPSTSVSGRASDVFQIVHAEMDIPWPIPGGRLGMLKLPSGTSAYARDLKRGLDMKQDRITYLSFMAQVIKQNESKTTSTDQERSRASLQLMLASSSSKDEQIALGYRNPFHPCIQSNAGVKFTSPLPIPPNEALLWVAKIVSRRSGEDEIYLRVYSRTDSPDYAEPMVWHVVSRDLKLDALLDRVIIRVSGMHSHLIDELRIGPTWRSVAPIRSSEAAHGIQELMQ